MAGSELVFPGAALAPNGLEAWKQVVERGYDGYVAKDAASVGMPKPPAVGADELHALGRQLPTSSRRARS